MTSRAPQDPKRPSAVISDWDNTLARGFLIFPWMDFLRDASLVDDVHIAELQRYRAAYQSGEISYSRFSDLCVDSYKQAINGVAAEAILENSRAFSQTPYLQESLYPVANILLAAARAVGVRVHIVSAAPFEPLRACADVLGIEKVFGLRVEARYEKMDSSRVLFTGHSVDKMMATASIANDEDVILALGDSTSDIPILRAAKYRIVVAGGNLVDSAPLDSLHLQPDEEGPRLREFLKIALGGSP